MRVDDHLLLYRLCHDVIYLKCRVNRLDKNMTLFEQRVADQIDDLERKVISNIYSDPDQVYQLVIL